MKAFRPASMLIKSEVATPAFLITSYYRSIRQIIPGKVWAVESQWLISQIAVKGLQNSARRAGTWTQSIYRYNLHPRCFRARPFVPFTFVPPASSGFIRVRQNDWTEINYSQPLIRQHQYRTHLHMSNKIHTLINRVLSSKVHDVESLRMGYKTDEV